MMMPVMSGLAATEFIMAYAPTPILIVSSSTNRGELFRIYEALAAGALDVMEKPTGDGDDDAWNRKLTETVKLVARIKVITHPRGKLKFTAFGAPKLETVQAPGEGRYRLIGIGASTGAPSALAQIPGRSFPPPFRFQSCWSFYIGEAFAKGFAEWLDGQSGLRVAYARDGDPLPQPGQGRVVLAWPGQHLAVSGGRLRMTNDPERHSCRPSVDVLFESMARELGASCAACLLTGMGRDGAKGLLAIRQAGGWTLAQDEATSVVFGMPREAILLGAAERIVPLGQVSSALLDVAGCRNGGGRP